MAYATGFSDNHLDLLADLRDFLVGTGGWDVIGGVGTGAIAHDDFVSFKGKGLGGTDQIFLTIKAHTNNPAGIYSLQMRGHTAYNVANPSDTPPGLNSPWVYLPLINDPIQYWFVANGRRFIAVCKANNRYDVFYGGFILPEHLPSDWAYPVLIGGSANALVPAAQEGWPHRNFWNCGDGTAYLFTPGATWRAMYNLATPINGFSENYINPDNTLCSVEWHNTLSFPNKARNIDLTPWMQEGRIVEYATSNLNRRNYLGVYDGLLYTPAAGAVVEQIIQHEGKDYLVIANVFRNSDNNLAAVCLE